MKSKILPDGRTQLILEEHEKKSIRKVTGREEITDQDVLDFVFKKIYGIKDDKKKV